MESLGHKKKLRHYEAGMFQWSVAAIPRKQVNANLTQLCLPQGIWEVRQSQGECVAMVESSEEI